MSRSIAVIAILLALPGVVHAKAGVQMCPGGERTLVSKDVGDERWAIMYNLQDHTAMGNVFFASGGPPAFVYCEQVGTDGNADPRQMMMTFSCFGAGACVADPCSPDDWSSLGDVNLPGEFFMPPAMDGRGMMGDQ